MQRDFIYEYFHLTLVFMNHFAMTIYFKKRVVLNVWQSLKSSSIFGESLRVVPRSSLKVSKTKNSSLVTRCEIGDSLV